VRSGRPERKSLDGLVNREGTGGLTKIGNGNRLTPSHTGPAPFDQPEGESAAGYFAI
jgi:hypothetical protein